MHQFASSAQLVLGYEVEFHFPLCYVAVPTPPYGVGVIVGHGFLHLSGIEAEHAPRVVLESLLASSVGFGRGRLGVFRLAHLHHGTAAVVGDANRYDIRLIIADR